MSNYNNISIIFDLDGTLVHSSPSLTKAANKLLKKINRPQVTLKTYESFIGKGIPNQIKCLLEFTGGIPDDGIEKYINIFREFYDQDPYSSSNCYDGVKETLLNLKKRGFNLAICTQKNSEPAIKLLKKLKIFNFFDGFAFGDSLDVMKPDPKMVEFALRGLEKGVTFYIGDSETDSMTAKNSNLKFFLFTGGYRKKEIDEIYHHEYFDNHNAILKLIEKNLKEY